MRSVILMDPFRCRMWDLHDRFEAAITEQSCKAEIESFQRHGQLVPVLGRPIRGDPQHEVELIYGGRRLFVARHLNKQILVEMRPMTDREAIVAMDIENRQRLDISPFERGFSYTRWLRMGLFTSQEELARSLRISSAQVSRLLRIARLPSVVVGAFEEVGHILEAWGLALAEAIEQPAERERIFQRARSIARAASRPRPEEVFRALIADPASAASNRRRAVDEVVKNRRGRPLFRIRQNRNSFALIVPMRAVSREVLDDIRGSLSAILDQEAAAPRAATRDARTHSKNAALENGESR